MRLDKYLKVSRIIKRRTVAKEASEGGRVTINGKEAKPARDVKAVSYTHLDVYKRQPLYMARIWGSVTWLSSTKTM